STVSPLVSPDAAQTHLLADNLHLSSAGQRIVADYEYSLLVAPGMISMMAEAPLKTRANVNSIIDDQMSISRRRRDPSGRGGWLSGDVASLKLDNTPGFPGDHGTPASLVGGLDYRFANDWLIGVAFSAGAQTARFDNSFGHFRQ